MQKSTSTSIAVFVLFIAFMFFMYGTYKVILIVNKTQIGTSEGIYTSYVTQSEAIRTKAYALTSLCSSSLCQVQKLLDFVTNIPYQSTLFQKKTAVDTIEENFGDCDDKSNLLISLLHARDIASYLVLVPKHIFVIVPIEDSALLGTKGLWVNGRKYYILESTAKDSKVGYPLGYRLDEIQAILEPFSNVKVKHPNLAYKR